MRKWIDMHCDTLSELLSAETLEENSLCVDRKRMEQTKMLAEFFACFVCVPDGKWEEAYQKVIEMIARMERETKENKKLKLIKTAKELEYAERGGTQSGTADRGRRRRFKMETETALKNCIREVSA